MVKASWADSAIFRGSGDWGTRVVRPAAAMIPATFAGRSSCEVRRPTPRFTGVRLLAVPGDDEVVVRTYRVMVIGSPR